MLPSEQLLDGLTEAQKAAVTHVDGPLLVLAGPGSGKTTVVTRRIAWLIAQGIPPWQILALTFTNKAAGEMRQRTESMLPDDLPGRRGLTVATFHSFCARLLRRYSDVLGLSANFSIYDAADQREAIKQALRNAELSERNFTPASVGAAISHAKNRLLDADAFAAEAGDFHSRSMARAYRAYEKILRSNDALDFDDLLMTTARMLRTRDDVRRELQERFRYLMIDEYQDTNHAQFVIAAALAAEHRNICVVGDPDQSIYGWRGADIRNILEFEEQYPEAIVVPLGQNFRSTGHIVSCADALIRHNKRRKHKTLHTELGDGEKPTVVICRDEHHEAELIVDECRRRNEEQRLPWKEMAVLYRINALSRVLEDAFRSAHLPYVIARGTAFYDRREIKDALSYLRLIANPSDEVALRRIINTPTRGIGKTTLDRIEAFALHHSMRFYDALHAVERVTGLSARAAGAVKKFIAKVDEWRAAAEQSDGTFLMRPAVEADAGARGRQSREHAIGDPLADLVARVIRESGMEEMYRKSASDEDLERLENLDELISAAAEFTPLVEDLQSGISGSNRPVLEVLRAFLESVALVSDADAIDPARGTVTLMTLHAAKGLEFDLVAMAGLEEGLLPHSRAKESELELEEERRLCFVGMTRARRHLLLTRAAARAHRGLRERTMASAFLAELPGEHIIESDQAGADDAFDPFDDDDFTRGGPGQSYAVNALFPRGCLVRHPTFGVGRVESVTPRPKGSSARVIFRGLGVKTLILEYAKLERLDEADL